MTPVAAYEQLLETIRAAWNAATARLTFADEIFDPNDATGVIPFVRVTMIDLPPGPTTHGAVGQRLTEQRGICWAQAFVPAITDDGAGNARELALAFRDVLHGQSLGADPIHFEPAAIEGKGTDGTWNRADVRIRFQYHERI